MLKQIIRVLAAISILAQTQLSEAASVSAYEPADSLFGKVSEMSVERMLDMADSSLKAGNPAEALSLYMTGYVREQSRADSVAATNLVRAYVGVGDIMMRRCDYAGALENYIQALMVSENAPSQPMAATIYKNIGNVYCCLNDYETGIDYYKKGLQICESHPDPDVEKKLLVNLSGMITYTGKSAEAEKYRTIARQRYPPVTTEEIFLDGLLDGLLLKSKKQYADAAQKFHEMAVYASRTGIEPRYEGSAYQELYTIYQEMGKPDSALIYMQHCRETAERNGLERMFPSVYEGLSEYYSRKGNQEKARQYRERYFDIRDSIMDDREFNAVKNVLFQYKAAKTAEEINSLYQEKERKESIIKNQRIVLISVIVGLCGLLGLLLVFYSQKRRITRSYRSLYEISRANANGREIMDRRYKEAMRLIEERDAEISRLNAMVTECKRTSEMESPSAEEPTKYKTSNLRDIHRNKLAEAITAVMENDSEELCNPEFSLERLAKIVGSNSKYVSQTINEEFNRNFNTYINDYRVKLACERLADSDYDSYKIKFIGESVGFKSQTTFTEAFRKHTGLSPSVYRKMAREERLSH